MGNSGSSINQSVQEMLKDYHEVRKENNGIILQDKNQQNTYFFKEHTYVDKNHYEKELQKFKQLQKEEPNENKLNLIKICTQQFNNFCSNSYKIYAVYEYPSVTLEDEIAARSKQGKYFQECQLWSILQSCANGLDSVKPSFSIHPKYVFVMSDGVLKVICNDLIEEDHRCIVKQHIYYAPEKIANFHQIQNEAGLRKQCIFSLGMTLLHAATLKQTNSCYNYQRFQFHQEQLQEFIKDLVSHNYSQDLIQIMAMMLEPNPCKRASLMEVHGVLAKACNTDTDNQQDQQKQEQQGQNEDNQQQINSQSSKKLTEMHRNQSQSNSHIQLLDKNHSSTSMQSMQYQNPSYNNYNIYPDSSKYQPYYQPPSDKQNLFTDPKLLEMIRKDLYDINEMKKNSTYFPQTGYNSRYYEPAYQQSYTQSYHVNSSYQNPQYKRQDQNQLRRDYTKEERKMSSVGSVTYNKQQSNPVSNNISVKSSKQASPNRAALKQTNTNACENELPPAKAFEKNTNSVYIKEQFEDGRKFQGNIVNGMKEGYGKLTYSDGAYYEGDFHQNKMEGKGVLYYMPGKPAYDGEWLSDQFHGFGILYNESPVPLIGSYNYNDFNMIEDYWVRYQGQFDSDNKCGQGKLILSTNQQFQGVFQNDSINGQGIFFTRNEKDQPEEIHGIWEDNVLVQIFSEHA